MNPMMEQRRHSKRQGETAVAAVVAVAAVPAAAAIRETAVESAVGTGETAEKADPEITTAEQIKSLPLSQQAVPYQYPPS